MKLLLTIVISAMSMVAFGQPRGYAGYIRIGSMGVPDARRVLPQLLPGISGFSSNFKGIGGELEFRVERTVFDAELMVLSHGPVNSGDQYAEPFTGGALLKAGYAVINGRNFLMYPNAGAGFGSVVVNTYQKSGNLKKQLHTIYLVQPVFDFGVSGNVIVHRFKNETPTGILPVGLRAGYRFSFASNNWRRVDGADVSPTAYSMHGWYVSVALGMGYVMNSNKHK